MKFLKEFWTCFNETFIEIFLDHLDIGNTFIAHFNFLGMFFFLCVFSFMNIHDSQDSRGRGRLFLLTFLYHFHLLYRHCLHFEDFLISLVIQGLCKSLAFMFFSLERNYHIWQEMYGGKFYRLIWVFINFSFIPISLKKA